MAVTDLGMAPHLTSPQPVSQTVCIISSPQGRPSPSPHSSALQLPALAYTFTLSRDDNSLHAFGADKNLSAKSRIFFFSKKILFQFKFYLYYLIRISQYADGQQPSC